MKYAAHGLSALGTIASVSLRYLEADPMLTFAVSALAVLGLAYTLGHSTEQLGIAAGPKIGGLLNATVGNIGEIIIACFLINAGQIDVVQHLYDAETPVDTTEFQEWGDRRGRRRDGLVERGRHQRLWFGSGKMHCREDTDLRG